MRLARTLFLLAATAIAALAFTASANAAVEVVDEDTGNHCSEVITNGTHTVTGGCQVSAATEPATTADLAIHTTAETIFSRCTNTFDARIHETGAGYIYNQVLAGAQCGRVPCDEGDGTKIPWPASLYEFVANSLNLQVTFCVRTNPGVNAPCTVSLPVTVEDVDTHSYEFRAATGTPNPVRCSQNFQVSLAGHWVSTDGAGGSSFEVTH